ncbi:MAG: 23S rRNA pseudouridine(1911/1915/1917) synthase RluD [Gammaproteobacteria bacterium]|nr:23S rRNA pseudouridine(1911/1915/1917) synthase RluD [Gammaproteobacteria bacterium]
MKIRREIDIPAEKAGRRLDQALAGLLPDFSRSRLKGWIESGCVSVDGTSRPPKYRLVGGERIVIEAELAVDEHVTAQNLPLDIVYEDDSIIVVNKPAGLVVHPGAGNPDRTLQNALLHHRPSLEALPRAGIVHRLDKETSGLLVVAATPLAHRTLVSAIEAREIGRKYIALVRGEVTSGGSVDKPIGRHATQRTKMSVRSGGREALTHFRVRERFRHFTLLDVQLETGRTHQIRVHMAYIRHPLVGDQVYGGRLALPPACGEALAAALRGFRRQALHASKLTLLHPSDGNEVEWSAPLPGDFEALLEVLRRAGQEEAV